MLPSYHHSTPQPKWIIWKSRKAIFEGMEIFTGLIDILKKTNYCAGKSI
jgi:hypothetical protein